MAQQVEIPDQGIAEFPDEMTPDEIAGVIKNQFYASPTPTPQTGEIAPPVVAQSATEYGQQQGLPDIQELTKAEQTFEQEHPYLYGAAKAVTGMIPTSMEQVKQMTTLPRVSNFETEQLPQSEQLGEAWRGEHGPVAQAEAITGTALQALPLTGLLFGKSPLRASPRDLALVEQMRKASPVPPAQGATTAPTLSETLFGKQEAPLVEEVNQSLADLESRYGTQPEIPNASKITSDEVVGVRSEGGEVGTQAPHGQQRPAAPAREGIEEGAQAAKDAVASRLTVGNVQERLAKAPHTLPTETLQDAITGANKAIDQMRESKVPTKPLEDSLNEVITGWQKIIDQRNATTKTEPDIVSTISTGKAESPTVYHVTTKDFQEFDPHQSQSLGMHFGDAKTAEALVNAAGKDARIIHAKLDIKNPIKLDADLVFQDPEKLANDLVKRGIISKKDIAPLTPEFDAVTKARDVAAFDDDPNLVAANQRGHVALQKVLQSKGYDALIYPNQFEGHGTSYAVFDPKQITPVQEATITTTGFGKPKTTVAAKDEVVSLEQEPVAQTGAAGTGEGQLEKGINEKIRQGTQQISQTQGGIVRGLEAARNPESESPVGAAPSRRGIPVSGDKIPTDGGASQPRRVTVWKAQRQVGDIKEGPKLGEFYTSSEQTAKSLADLKGDVTQHELVLNKPFTIPAKAEGHHFYDVSELNDLLKQGGVKIKLPEDMGIEPVWRHIDEGGTKLVNALKKAGYDSIQYPEFLGRKDQTTTLVFKGKPSPVPSAEAETTAKTSTQEISIPEGEIGATASGKPQIPETATAKVQFRTPEGEPVIREMDAREAEGIFTKEKSSYKALIDCLLK